MHLRASLPPLHKPSRTVLLLLALTGLLTLAACAGSYSNENGPRGPERFTWGPGWPCAPGPTDCSTE